MIRKIAILFLFLSLSYMGFSQDVTPPEPVTITYVTVDYNTGNVSIYWNPSTSIDVAGYYIYNLQSGYWINIGSVPASPNPFYLHNTSHANSSPESYRVAAYDGATPRNVSAMCDPHTTMHMGLDFQPCHAYTRVFWTPYLGWTNSVIEYDIYCNTGSGWFQTGTVDGSQTSYMDNNLTPDITYQYYIKAIGSGNLSSTSNMNSVLTNMPHRPTILNANFCSVTAPNQVLLSFTIDPTADIVEYKLIRSDSTQMHYDTIQTWMAAGITGNIINYTDHFDTNNDFYFYRLIAVNTCYVNIDSSNVASNIILKVSPKEDMTDFLSWNNYRSWVHGINEYKLYRISDIDTVMFATVHYGNTTYSDNLQNYIYFYNNPTHIKNPYYLQPKLDGHFCYYLSAYEYNGNGISNSNIACTGQSTRLFVPNAFTPNSDGINDVFSPMITFTDARNYSFVVYDRWGNIVFTTNDTRGFWDGKIGGKPAASGAYVYLVKYKSSDGTDFQQTGTFTLYY